MVSKKAPLKQESWYSKIFFWRSSKYAPETAIKREETLDTVFLLDFNNIITGNFVPEDEFEGGNLIEPRMLRAFSKEAAIDKSIVRVKPIDVLNELETLPLSINLENIDSKIAVLQAKKELITQRYTRREINGLIERLNNRKKYAEYKDFFERFQNTNDTMIQKLLDKHHLVKKPSDIFIPEFPDDAIKVMQEYTEQVKLICNKKPVFYVIAENDKFKKLYEKRDLILLVQSPFGFYWQILGAWDKEMLLLSEL